MNQWIKIRLGDIIETNKNTYSSKEQWSFVNYLDTGNIVKNKIDEIQYIDLSIKKLPSRAKRKVKYNSIIYSTVRPNQHHHGIIKEQPENFLVSTGFTVIDVNCEKANPDYIYYVLSQNEITEYLQGIGEQSVSAYPSIKPLDIENLEITLPKLEIQNKIVNILSTIDGKIKNNIEINNNLEQQLRSLYKSWFVDYEPFDKIDSISWKQGKLKDILKLERNSIKPGTNNDLPYLPIDVIPMHTFALSDFKANKEAKSSLISFEKDDIVIGAMRVYFHRVILAPCAGITRTTCFTLKPYLEEYLSYALLCCDQDNSIEYAQTTSKESTMPYAIWDGGLGEMEIIIPPTDIAKKFNKIALPMLRQIQNSYFENQKLKTIRDSLLPRLMSGELDVSNIDF